MTSASNGRKIRWTKKGIEINREGEKGKYSDDFLKLARAQGESDGFKRIGGYARNGVGLLHRCEF